MSQNCNNSRDDCNAGEAGAVPGDLPVGGFPEQLEMSFYSLAWIDRATRKPYLAAPNNAVIQVGIDVAGPGEDETVLVARAGRTIIAQ